MTIKAEVLGGPYDGAVIELDSETSMYYFPISQDREKECPVYRRPSGKHVILWYWSDYEEED